MKAELLFYGSFFAILCAMGCGSTKTSNLSIVISGDTAGWITPCGCTANQSGGLERRATLLRTLGPSDQTVYLDAGGSVAGKSEYQQVKLQSILRGDQLMGLEAHNVGAPETQLAPETLIQIGLAANSQWVSANLTVDHANDATQSAILPYRILVRKGVRILITGVVDPSLVKNRQWKAKDPSSSVLSVLGKEKQDITVVLAYMDEPNLRSLAESLPEVDFIVGGPTGQMLIPSNVGPVTIMSATNKGKFLARIELQKEGKDWKAIKRGPIEVSSTFDREPAQSKNLDAYLSELAERDFASTETGLVSNIHSNGSHSMGYQIAGSHTCIACHTASDQAWHSSKHSHAWKTLMDKRSHVDPSCQQCHTTGYGIPGGFEQVFKSEPLVNVGCESCHGPSQAHAGDPKIMTPFLSREQCVRCHDHENSPEFDYAKYWEKIKHGK